MAEIFGFDAYSPKEIAERVESLGVGGGVMVALVYYFIYGHAAKDDSSRS
jgi:hypothetical protein